MRLEAFRPTCRLTRCVALSELLPSICSRRRAESDGCRVWRVLLYFRIVYKIRCDLQRSSQWKFTAPGESRSSPPTARMRTSSSSWISVIIIIMGFSVFCIALEPDGVPLLTCSACSDCHPTLAQLLPLPKVSHVNLKVVVHGAAGRLSQSLSLSLNRFAGNVSFGVGDFIGAMTVA